jgi:hypothetical protein
MFMCSVEKDHPEFAENCHRIRTGQSAYSIDPRILFDLHRYRDGWHVYWKNPPNDQIGRYLRTRMELNAFLAGNWRIGLVLDSPTKEGLVFRRQSKRGKERS